jgi:hypothetical protein
LLLLVFGEPNSWPTSKLSINFVQMPFYALMPRFSTLDDHYGKDKEEEKEEEEEGLGLFVFIRRHERVK